jgi:DNA-binding transcriptional ArsR family regulator
MASPEVNSVGDLVLTDPAAMRALADPFRLALLDRLRRQGPATAGELSSALESSPSSLEDHLRGLERFGFVSRVDDDRWQAVAKGLVFEIPEDPEGQAAARQLANVMLLQYADEPRRWAAEAQPRLELDWVRASGLLNARVALTPDELRGLQDSLEQLLEPFLTRDAGDLPPQARRVRVLGYFLPDSS